MLWHVHSICIVLTTFVCYIGTCKCDFTVVCSHGDGRCDCVDWYVERGRKKNQGTAGETGTTNEGSWGESQKWEKNRMQEMVYYKATISLPNI